MDHYVITISRSYGSGGKVIGRKLSELLGIGYYDNDILRIASETSGINEKLFAQNDEKVGGITFRKRASISGDVISSDKKGFLSIENLFNYQAHVIRELAQKESFVVIGRAANYILFDFPNVISVNIHANFEDCVKAVLNRTALKRGEAEKLIRKKNRERAEFYFYYTGHTWADALGYDLTLNSSKVGYDNCVLLIKQYTEMKLATKL